ncbi:ABC transporter permease [Novipirellula artificiosorum]|uniref:Transport permease protein n=1 Tax=Novipirellula artificiosorum TaxID=2528016 RepID=A0A5C6DFC3_9BACT|nr:ABC transporter permease [Novipirellula artificiosorum]TWU34517.1 Teichoic acid translocation permease protein TagG [Novipirellula artificiosorum]
MASLDNESPDPSVVGHRPTADSGDWDLVIRPDSSLLSLRLGEVWRYRDLLYLFTRRDIVAFYKQTILGPLWFFIQPLFTTLVYVLVFGKIAGLSTDGIPQVLFYLCGITFWNYFAECFSKTATVFKDNAHIFSKVYFPRLIAPLSIVLSNLVRFAIQFALLLAFLAWYLLAGQVAPNATALWLPVLVLIMATLGLAMGMLFSAMTTKYRDLVFLLQFGIQLLMYATPVIYPSSEMPPQVAAVLRWNPLAPLFETARYGLLGAGEHDLGRLGYSALFSAVALLFATVVFNHVERRVMDTV